MADSRLIFGGAVVTVDSSHRVLDPGWVVVSNGVITQLGEGEPPADVVSLVDEQISAVGCAVMPGMTNAHTHLFQSFSEVSPTTGRFSTGFVNASGLQRNTSRQRLRIARNWTS